MKVRIAYTYKQRVQMIRRLEKWTRDHEGDARLARAARSLHVPMDTILSLVDDSHILDLAVAIGVENGHGGGYFELEMRRET